MSTLTGTLSNPKGITGFIKRNPVISMYAIMFAIAWSVMIPQALHSQGILGQPIPEILEILIGWSPAIASILVSAVIAGGAAVRELLKRFLIWRVGLRWYVLGALLMAVLILGGIGLHVLFGGRMPAIPAAEAPLWQLPFIVLLLVLMGFLFNTEEVAWRGFALPRLQRRFGPLGAVLLIAIPESFLHLPLFWMKENPFFQTVGLYWYSAFSIAAVVLYMYIFNKTKGSLLIVTLLHASQNTWANLLSDNSASPFHYTVVLTWLVALALIVLTRGMLGYEADKHESR